jgi:hypothetical protein
MNWPEILSVSALTTVGVGALGFLSKEWISTRLKESVAAEYKEALEVFKQQLAWRELRKRQAVEIAELFALWMQHNYDSSKDVNLTRYDLQKKYWELALWLDEPILKAVHKAFQSAPNPGIAHKEALIEVRRLIVGKDDEIRAEDLFHFDAIKPSP